MKNLAEFHIAITNLFSLSELKMLCFYLDIDFDNLPGETREEKAQELISYVQRRERLNELAELCKKLRPNFRWNGLFQTTLLQPNNISFQISVECADITDFPCDVLVLKYAGKLHGADQLISEVIGKTPSLNPGEFAIYSSNQKINAKNTLFIGVNNLYQFRYEEIRAFAEFSIRIVAQELISAKTVAMTVHGVGYGLDEKESFLAQLAGIARAFEDPKIRSQISHVTIVERAYGRASRLRQILKENIPTQKLFASGEDPGASAISKSIEQAGIGSLAKPHIFVAMPFNEETEDIFTFGIQEPVNSSGYLCERVDMLTFTGDILNQIKSRIETAHLVIAELSGANPNVYLEVGYAWGKNRPTLLIAKTSAELRFDVKNQRCIIYKNIKDLAQKIKTDLANLSKATN